MTIIDLLKSNCLSTEMRCFKPLYAGRSRHRREKFAELEIAQESIERCHKLWPLLASRERRLGGYSQGINMEPAPSIENPRAPEGNSGKYTCSRDVFKLNFKDLLRV